MGDNIEVGARETGCDNVDWIHLDQGMNQWWDLQNMVMNLRSPQESANFLTRFASQGRQLIDVSSRRNTCLSIRLSAPEFPVVISQNFE